MWRNYRKKATTTLTRWSRLLSFVLPAILCCSACDHGLEAEPEGQSGIAGRLSFTGAWPDEIGQVAVAVYQDYPRELTDFFALSGWDTGVELGVASYDFFVPIERDGVYRWVVVAWRRQDSFWDFTSLLGCYHVSGDSLPAPVVVRAGEITGGINMAVDLGVVRGEQVQDQSLCLRPLPAELLEQAGR